MKPNLTLKTMLSQVPKDYSSPMQCDNTSSRVCKVALNVPECALDEDVMHNNIRVQSEKSLTSGDIRCEQHKVSLHNDIHTACWQNGNETRPPNYKALTLFHKRNHGRIIRNACEDLTMRQAYINKGIQRLESFQQAVGVKGSEGEHKFHY